MSIVFQTPLIVVSLILTAPSYLTKNYTLLTFYISTPISTVQPKGHQKEDWQAPAGWPKKGVMDAELQATYYSLNIIPPLTRLN